MDLILWRHADAEQGGPDLARRLTPRGVKQAGRMAQWLAPRLPEHCRVIASPAVRARMTAEALGRRFDIVDAIAPGAGVKAVLAAADWPRASAVVVVGHQPTLGAVASFLLSGEEASWSIRKGAVWWLADRARDDGESAVLRVAIAPDFV
jgi:phosphohistidine phosphatase